MTRWLLDGEPDIDVVGEAEDGRQAVALARQRAATVVLMDIRMPVMDGLEATRQLSGAGVQDPPERDAPGRSPQAGARGGSACRT
nr:response regulator transcription factor [Frankia sp. QA3]